MATREPSRRAKRTSAPRKSGAATQRKPRTAKSKAKAQPRRSALPIAAAMGLATAALAALGLVLRRRAPAGDGSFGRGEHPAPDLAPGAAPAERAPEAFRPDPTAPIPAGERDAFRPALSRPTLVEPDRPAEPRADTAGGSTLSPQGGRVTDADDADDAPAQTTRNAGTGNL